MLRLHLEKDGYQVKMANDGAEGVNFFKIYEPDLVLLDIMLPKKDGWQVCREIREISSKPVIMITAKGDVFDKVLGLELGADDFVVKPFDMKELSARVKAVLRRYSTQGIRKQGTALRRGGDIVEYQFICARLIIEPGQGHRVAHIPEAFKIHAFDHTAIAHIQAGNNSLGQHTSTSPLATPSARDRSSLPA
jgi:DNA-binding response OmpR family regulator